MAARNSTTEDTIQSARARKHPGKSFPPAVLSFSPPSDEILRQIQAPFLEEARQRLDRFLFFMRANDDFTIKTPQGQTLRLSKNRMRSKIAEMAQGQYWELMNISEFLFNWNKDPKSKPVFGIQTSHFDIDFHDHETCYEFLSEMAGKWEDWGKEGSKPDGGCSTAR